MPYLAELQICKEHLYTQTFQPNTLTSRNWIKKNRFMTQIHEFLRAPQVVLKKQWIHTFSQSWWYYIHSKILVASTFWYIIFLCISGQARASRTYLLKEYFARKNQHCINDAMKDETESYIPSNLTKKKEHKVVFQAKVHIKYSPWQEKRYKLKNYFYWTENDTPRRCGFYRRPQQRVETYCLEKSS